MHTGCSLNMVSTETCNSKRRSVHARCGAYARGWCTPETGSTTRQALLTHAVSAPLPMLPAAAAARSHALCMKPCMAETSWTVRLGGWADCESAVTSGWRQGMGQILQPSNHCSRVGGGSRGTWLCKQHELGGCPSMGSKWTAYLPRWIQNMQGQL